MQAASAGSEHSIFNSMRQGCFASLRMVAIVGEIDPFLSTIFSLSSFDH
jgi:hypothetical protein